MTLQDLEELANKSEAYLETEDYIDNINSDRSHYTSFEKGKIPFCICAKEIVRGYTGGSYHSDSYCHPFTDSDAETKVQYDIDNALNLVLEKICSTITLLQYNRVYRDLIQETEYTETEYYGNDSVHCIKYFVFEELFKRLLTEGLVEYDSYTKFIEEFM